MKHEEMIREYTRCTKNILSSYANWLRKYTNAADILDRIYQCFTEGDYEDLLKALADRLLDDERLERMAQRGMVDSIYEAEGPYRFELMDDEDEDEEWEDEDEDW